MNPFLFVEILLKSSNFCTVCRDPHKIIKEVLKERYTGKKIKKHNRDNREEELLKEDNNNGRNNNGDWSEEIESISQRLREQYIKGLSGIEEGHSQNTFWPETQSDETGKTRLNSITKKENAVNNKWLMHIVKI